MKHRHDYSQYFLKSPQLVEELFKLTSLGSTDTVYDIGAGSGIISSVLAKHCQEVYAIEYESEAFQALQRNTRTISNVHPLNQDILQLSLPTGDYAIFANIPFHISADIVRRFALGTQPPFTMYLIVQRQFAQKLECKDAHFTSTLGAQIAPFFQIRQLRQLKQSDFLPEPRVDTMFIEIKKRPEPFVPLDQQATYCNFVQKCYSNQSFFTSLKPLIALDSTTTPAKMTVTQWLLLWQASEAVAPHK